MAGLTHVDGDGKAAMVNVGGKPVQRRRARASGSISLAAATITLIRDNAIKKGDGPNGSVSKPDKIEKLTVESVPVKKAAPAEK